MPRASTKNNPHRDRITFSEAHKPERIKDGDILLCSGDYCISRLFECLTQGRYSHAAIAAWWEPAPAGDLRGTRLMLLQAEAFGIEAVPLHRAVKQYPGKVKCYGLQEWYRQVIDLHVVLFWAKTGLGLKFGYCDALGEIARRVCQREKLQPRAKSESKYPKDPDQNLPSGMFCSQYVSWCFRKGGEEVTKQKIREKCQGCELPPESEVDRLMGGKEKGIALTPKEDKHTFPQDIDDSKAVTFRFWVDPDRPDRPDRQ